MARSSSPIRFSCADFTFPLLSHEKAIELIAMLGMEGVDIGVMAANSHTRPQDILKSVARTARSFLNRIERHGLVASDVFLIPGTSFPALAINHPDRQARRRSRDVFSRTLEFAARLNSQHMTILPGVPWEKESKPVSLKRSAEELSWRIEKAATANVVLAIEPHLGSIVPRPSDVMRLLKLTPGLTLTLDYSHFVFQGFKHAAIDPLLEYSSHFHARGATKGRMQTGIDQSTIDYSRVVRAMRRHGYSGYICFEFEYLDVEPGNEVDTLSETIRLSELLHKKLA